MVLRLEVVNEEEDERIDINVDPTADMSETIETLKSYWGVEEEFQFFQGSKPLPLGLKWSESEIDNGDRLFLRKISTVRELPHDIWDQRINNEIAALEDQGYTMDVQKGDEVNIDVKLEDVPGPVLIGKSLGTAFEHGFRLHLSREYPFTRPVVTWNTSIFHPNILPPEKGGNIKMNYLERWDISDNLSMLLSSIEKLLTEPELDNRLDDQTCRAAAERYID